MPSIPFYDDPAYDYKTYWQERKYEDLADQLALKKLLAKIPPGENLIDIGAGFGRMVPVYTSKFKHFTLVDPSEKMLDKAKKRIKRRGTKFIKAYGEKLPFKKEGFDVALMIRTIHHLENPQKTLKEVQRILKPQGFLILEFANKLHLKTQIKAFLSLRWGYFFDPKPIKVGQKKKKTVPFYNYHPQYIKKILKNTGFNVLQALSVSNFRNPIFKKFLPLKSLLFAENLLQKIYAPFYLGPSIFLLCQKK